ncbi:MAG TPA: DUF4402 domain-containing protein [Bacteroidales bacterium]|nr:DUF4402 domain-containing protein [Bacteroidales bacterium]
MKKLMLSVFVLATIAFSANAAGGNTASGTASADAKLVTAISVTKNVDLQFGEVSISGADGSVTLTAAAAAAPVSEGGVQHLNNVAQTAAKFTVTGQSGLGFDISLPSATATLTDGTHNLTVDLTASATTGAIGSSDVFYVGGKLNVLAASVAGTYSGSFNVNVAYN